jgi:hypothetical protein
MVPLVALFWSLSKRREYAQSDDGKLRTAA